MKIFKLGIQNFRLLKDFSIDLEKDLSLIIGKNNSGKTSILSVLDRFLNEKTKFTFDDLNIEFKNELKDLVKAPEVPEFLPIGIKLKVFIDYEEQDDLSNVSRVLMDLDPNNNVIVLGFEYTLRFADFIRLRQDFSAFQVQEEKKKEKDQSYVVKELVDFLGKFIGDYFDIRMYSYEYDIVTHTVIESNCIDIKQIAIKDILNFKYISARRDVSNKDVDKTLSRQTSLLYKKKEDSNEKNQATEDFKDQLSGTDLILSTIYKDLFSDVIDKVKTFGGIKFNDSDIAVISTLQHRELLEGNTTIVYAHDDYKLPEYYNGLGYMNLISMIFEIEIQVQDFKRERDKRPSDINLLFIEEPEAHTHPQMQYVFIKNIKQLLQAGIQREDGFQRPLQYIITTHSSHIVADSDFDDIKYLKLDGKNSIVARNLKDLKRAYTQEDPKQYDFLKQYLTISRAEVFFADKVILIEGDTEKILLPTFMRKVDLEEKAFFDELGQKDQYLPLLSQNISIVEVGAYAHIFKRFVAFLGVKSLIITDIDSIHKIERSAAGKIKWEECSVEDGTASSNTTLNHFLEEVPWNEIKALPIEKRTFTDGTSVFCLCYQQLEDDYHPRSFEDAFIHKNRSFVNNHRESFRGLKKIEHFDTDMGVYELTQQVIKKKTHFALDILYHSTVELDNWEIPSYIKEGLLWLKQD